MAKNTLDETKEIKILLSQIRALSDTIQEILNNDHVPDFARYVSYRDMASMYNDLAERVRDVMKVNAMFYTFNVDKMPGWGDTVWPSQKKIIEQVLVSTKMLYSCLSSNADFADDEFDNLENFIKSRLRTVIFSRPEKEIEVQNAIESLLAGRGLNKGVDYDRETGKFEFSGKEYIPDLSLIHI